MSNGHRFIQYDETKPLITETRQIAAYILNRFLKQDLSVGKYLKKGKLNFTWNGKNTSFRFDDLVDHIRSTRSLDHNAFGLPRLEHDWLDEQLGLGKPDAPIANVERTEFLKLTLATVFGEKFPYQPCIDREGVMFSTFQIAIQQNIIRLHQKLLDEAYLAPNLDGIWLNDVRMLINECVSIVDITLHQLYFMAQYKGIEKGWRFEPDKLAKKDGMRLSDKLCWIGKITGKPFDTAPEEVKKFKFLKSIRNHFNHFDPPCVAYTMEDLVHWLNFVPDVGRLLWKISERLGSQLSKNLIEIIFLPRVKFVPTDPSLSRIPQPPDVGYLSSIIPIINSLDPTS